MLKLTLVAEIQALLSCRRPPLLDRCLRRWLPVQSYEGPTKILTTQPRSLSFTDADMPKLTVLAAVIMSCLPFGRHCSRSTERGCHVACALIGTNCLRYGRVVLGGVQRGYEWYMYLRALFIISDLPYIYTAIMVLTSCDNWNKLSHLACATV